MLLPIAAAASAEPRPCALPTGIDGTGAAYRGAPDAPFGSAEAPFGTARSERDEPSQARESAQEKSTDAPAPLLPDGTEVLAGPGFGAVLGAPGLAALACAAPAAAKAALRRAVLGAETRLAVDAELAIVFTSTVLPCSNLYYVPLSNDIRGIGYAHHDAGELFDETPQHRLEGVAFLNDWPYWSSRSEELESALAHELGHRWGARSHARVRGMASASWLGRGQSHWSYYLDTRGSPLEGNLWRGEAPAFESDTPAYPHEFSAFDLYAMGVTAPNEVPPVVLLGSPRGSGRDCTGESISAASPPQTCGPRKFEAESLRVSIEDVIAVEGPRSPPALSLRRSVDVLVLMLQSSNQPWDREHCAALAAAVPERIAGFERASSGRLNLVNVLDGAAGCDELARASSRSAAALVARSGAVTGNEACTIGDRVSARGARAGPAGVLAGCGAAWFVRRRRRR